MCPEQLGPKSVARGGPTVAVRYLGIEVDDALEIAEQTEA
jgi:hypothetical protein